MTDYPAQYLIDEETLQQILLDWRQMTLDGTNRKEEIRALGKIGPHISELHTVIVFQVSGKESKTRRWTGPTLHLGEFVMGYEGHNWQVNRVDVEMLSWGAQRTVFLGAMPGA